MNNENNPLTHTHTLSRTHMHTGYPQYRKPEVGCSFQPRGEDRGQ